MQQTAYFLFWIALALAVIGGCFKGAALLVREINKGKLDRARLQLWGGVSPDEVVALMMARDRVESGQSERSDVKAITTNDGGRDVGNASD